MSQNLGGFFCYGVQSFSFGMESKPLGLGGVQPFRFGCLVEMLSKAIQS